MTGHGRGQPWLATQIDLTPCSACFCLFLYIFTLLTDYIPPKTGPALCRCNDLLAGATEDAAQRSHLTVS
ncbi:uncharacterized protein BO66DRAFT_146728 [Aspergillus aculeatinus CBS 121060]|uniref:Uncharacterized protein n=1 Tax=Aspergillus aculeatinus CBS 121060 TaxID=1448322 RepID=A0ACD1HLM1_9EURO|nr:hypothetical protein BO66DRAFT_146728 [Aspergillus aculeatinus CBS 121060]RAH74329.1 hypothetical protein BO66DRAFT_146728 [Aspergillus aculeatinus CBS 121060]